MTAGGLIKMSEQNKINVDVYKLFVQTIVEVNSIELMANKLTQLLVGALGLRGATVFVLDPDKESLEILASAGLSNDYIQKGPVLVDKSIRLGPNREPVIIGDVLTSDKLQYPEDAKREGIGAIVSYPIKMRSKIIGALRLYHSEKWDISENDLHFVEALAMNIGAALMYFRLATAVKSVKDTVGDIHPIWL
jgi:transcriptional regulator with GAF, ATPase, and Fis domain